MRRHVLARHAGGGIADSSHSGHLWSGQGGRTAEAAAPKEEKRKAGSCKKRSHISSHRRQAPIPEEQCRAPKTNQKPLVFLETVEEEKNVSILPTKTYKTYRKHGGGQVEVAQLRYRGRTVLRPKGAVHVEV